MLYRDQEIIFPKTFSLLEKLQGEEDLRDFFLVGGTALALQLGHRLSVDLDFFCTSDFNTQKLTGTLQKKYSFQLNSIEKNTLLGFIDEIKVDFITHAYPLVEQLRKEEGIRLASVRDIGAMKLNAIAHSGQRLKDFFDLYFILEHLPLASLLEAYQFKYVHSNVIIPLKALTYFEDLNPNEPSPLLKEKISKKKMKYRLLDAVENPNRVF